MTIPSSHSEHSDAKPDPLQFEQVSLIVFSASSGRTISTSVPLLAFSIISIVFSIGKLLIIFSDFFVLTFIAIRPSDAKTKPSK